MLGNKHSHCIFFCQESCAVAQLPYLVSVCTGHRDVQYMSGMRWLKFCKVAERALSSRLLFFYLFFKDIETPKTSLLILFGIQVGLAH